MVAISRGGTPLASNCLADAILLSVICRLRPPRRPDCRAISVSEGPAVWQFGNASAHTTSGWTHPYPATFDVVNAGPRPAALRLVIGSAKDWTTWYTTVQTGTLVPGQAGRVTVSLGGHGGVPAEIFLR